MTKGSVLEAWVSRLELVSCGFSSAGGQAKCEGFKLVSGQFRRQRLALWAAGGGPDPSFSSMVFWPCDTVPLPKQFKKEASCKSKQASWKLAVQEGKRNVKVSSYFQVSSERQRLTIL